jgi:SAM-dependent methyltransferase
VTELQHEQTQRPVAEVPSVDPFTIPVSSDRPGRRRLASYVGRTGRAQRWLPSDAHRVLDVGCSTGYGTAGVAVARPSSRVVGIESDPDHLAEAWTRFPWLTILEGDATTLPLADDSVDAVLLLDVVEHVAEPERALAEAHRVLRPGGVLVLSVPHRGLLSRLDALNVYASLRRRRPSWPPLEAATESGGAAHRHFAKDELERLLDPWFDLERVTRTGLGLAEIIQIIRLLIRAADRAPRTRQALAWLYLLAYLAEDPFPFGPLAYHLTVRARARPERSSS